MPDSAPKPHSEQNLAAVIQHGIYRTWSHDDYANGFAEREQALAALGSLVEQNELLDANAKEFYERMNRAEEQLEAVIDVAIWLSALVPHEGEAWNTWENIMRPKLYKAMESNPASDPFVVEPMDLGLPVDNAKIAEEIRIRNEVQAAYFRDDYPEASNQDSDPASSSKELRVASSPASERGEFHAEGLDERGIYGGRSYPARNPDA